MKLIPISLIIRLKIFKRALFYQRDYNIWLLNGKHVPPPHLAKKELIKKYQNKHKTNVLIETGTYIGEMVNAQKNNFKSIFSIEIQPELFEAAKKRFKNNKNIHIMLGDSGLMLQTLVPSLNEKGLFWLDGHYSGGITGMSNTECPIFNELSAIFENNKNHIIVIDDANCFTGQNDYPTIENLIGFIKSKDAAYSTKIEDNAIIVEKLD